MIENCPVTDAPTSNPHRLHQNSYFFNSSRSSPRRKYRWINISNTRASFCAGISRHTISQRSVCLPFALRHISQNCILSSDKHLSSTPLYPASVSCSSQTHYGQNDASHSRHNIPQRDNLLKLIQQVPSALHQRFSIFVLSTNLKLSFSPFVTFLLMLTLQS